MKRRFTLKLEKLFILCLIGVLSLQLLPFGVMAAGNDGEIDLSEKGIPALVTGPSRSCWSWSSFPKPNCSIMIS